jgi:hypothetical protein
MLAASCFVDHNSTVWAWLLKKEVMDRVQDLEVTQERAFEHLD